MALVFGGSGVGSGRNPLTMEFLAGDTYLLPSGTWALNLGLYTEYEQYDQQTLTWRVPGDSAGRCKWVDSDGVNSRLANVSGCVVGATVTSGGVGYTSAPTVTVNSGSATFTAVLGPVVNTIAVINGGSGYTIPPMVSINTPPPPGVAATAYSAISGGVVTSITVTDQGAGFLAGVPSVSLINDSRDTTGAGATAVASLTGQGTVAAVLCTSHGTPTGISTTGVLPTLTFAGGGYTTTAAAVPVMAWSVTGYTVSTAGSGYATALLTGYATASGSATYTNPTIQSNLLRQRMPWVTATVSSSTGIITGGAVIDGGFLPALPTSVVVGGVAGTGAVVAVTTFTVGGQNDAVILQPV